MALDLSKLSAKDLEYVAAGQMDKVSDEGLAQLSNLSDVMAGESMQGQQDQQPASRTGLQDFGRGAGLMLRGMAPAATGAGAGFMVGGPPGALAGALTLPLAELATQGINLALPQDYQIPSPQAGVEGLMTRMGLPVPETMPEQQTSQD